MVSLIYRLRNTVIIKIHTGNVAITPTVRLYPVVMTTGCSMT